MGPRIISPSRQSPRTLLDADRHCPASREEPLNPSALAQSPSPLSHRPHQPRQGRALCHTAAVRDAVSLDGLYRVNDDRRERPSVTVLCPEPAEPLTKRPFRLHNYSTGLGSRRRGYCSRSGLDWREHGKESRSRLLRTPTTRLGNAIALPPSMIHPAIGLSADHVFCRLVDRS